MIDPSEVRIDTGRHENGGTFVRVVHLPTGLARERGPIGTSAPQQVRDELLDELEVELAERQRRGGRSDP